MASPDRARTWPSTWSRSTRPHDRRSTIDGILDVALVFSDIYDRWPGLETYDVCQEPADPDGTQGPEPLPVTQIELTRAESDAIDWDTVTVEDLVRGSRADPPELALRVSTRAGRRPRLRRRIVGATTTTTAPDRLLGGGPHPAGDGLGDALVAALEVVALALDPHVGDVTGDGGGVVLELLGGAEGVAGAGHEEARHLERGQVLDAQPSGRPGGCSG